MEVQLPICANVCRFKQLVILKYEKRTQFASDSEDPYSIPPIYTLGKFLHHEIRFLRTLEKPKVSS